MKVFVVMGNDFPDSVWSTQELADKAIEQNEEADKVARPYGPGIHWRSYEFNADNDRQETTPHTALHFVFDGPPSHESGRFVEVETPEGRSVNAGEWRERKDGLWELVVDFLSIPGNGAFIYQRCGVCGKHTGPLTEETE